MDPAELVEALAGPVDEVAPRLLGSTLCHAGVTVRLTEVEAYGGADDPGSHAFRGRTERNDVMFGSPGRLYVYVAYGMHPCANVVTGEEGLPSAVLLRAGEVVGGLELARARRPGSCDRDLARGPACLCRALDLGPGLDGADLTQGPVVLTLAAPSSAWATGPRVGLRGAATRPWRYWLPDEPTVSAYRPAKGLPRPL